ncbi:GTPase Obg [Philodulcilactobacillus myokoensis]|uniref:GTPase Obg n=1 Tax=Philodulcilactobacillus myokoensis TaxID=2929573 RepID=A0A9W6B1B4_9LACO|nr:GTPase ObgE [Philodulcilactobacillus myokoensis]GLB46976.1 GTPase Obg [Philodulcilactobacillus myokoensis]
MFVDQVKISIKAGKGGNGAVAFRREKFVPNGGPAGGDGGRGGNVIFKVNSGLSTLMDLRYRRKIKAASGGNGGNKKMTGRSAEDTIIDVPEGTTIYGESNNQILCDLTHPGDSYTAAKGGRGGRGNVHFASAKNTAPEIAENGEPGEEKNVRLELKLLADVGLVGFPSVGKSTLLSTITTAKPKIAGYHFTTLIPNLGMVRLRDGSDFVIADMPGLIKGASQGIGLGFQFLRHIERTRVLLHLIDMSGVEGRDPYHDYLTINKELKDYDPDLMKRPQIIVATKMDMPNSNDNLAKFKSKVSDRKIIPISSITHDGLLDLIHQTVKLLDQTPKFPAHQEKQSNQKNVKYTFKEEKPFQINRDENGNWILSGHKIEKLFQMTDTAHHQSMLRFARQLHGMGVDKALRDAGAKDGDNVSILDFTFTYVD